ncbi:hypothetical protein [Allorhodopirellula solitaria]|uniref:Uncharacterized protein n=1 Tax=Allorhodopirellula solitaria TaxID=2527987 RepID=A0A5C5XW81_9BACT|nr:hypothetical protein [Allorhodopirellula solitaria]TWT67170.1 hypothetical protein CA85_20190 [Allorhodopirellula solitaria]
MRHSLPLFLCLAVLPLPAALAETPCSAVAGAPGLLSSALTSFEQESDFPFRFVAYLQAADSPMWDEPDDRSIDVEESWSLLPIRVQDATLQAPIQTTVETVAEAGASEASASGQLDDTERLTQRLAELNKPARLLSIEVPAAQPGDAPVNQAAQVFNRRPFWVHGGVSSPPPPQRVHITFYHQPTYYQELNLERCGRLDCECCGCLQNLSSSIWFVGNTLMLPYRAASQPHCQCVPSYGDCPTCHQYDCPVEPLCVKDGCASTSRGLLSQSAALAGFALLLW